MMVAGRLDIQLDGSCALARIASSRPLTAHRQFLGRTPAEVLQSLPLLFGVCGMAQGVAFVTACEDALGTVASAALRRMRQVLVLSETAREHLLRIAMDWPRFAGSEPDLSLLRRIMTLDRRIRDALVAKALTPGCAEGDAAEAALGLAAELGETIEADILGEGIPQWLERGRPEQIADWARWGHTAAQRTLNRLQHLDAMEIGAVALDALPPIADGELLPLLASADADRLVARPEWEGRTRETTALARQAGHPMVRAHESEAGFGLGARLIALLVELVMVPSRLRALAAGSGDEPDEGVRSGDGAGIGQIEAARGRLVHGVRIAQGRLIGYVVLAPTEWNFHPDGAAARALGAIARSKSPHARLLADMMITAFDPCVEYTTKGP